MISGWVGATDKLVMRYAQAWADHGLPSLRFTQPPGVFFNIRERPRIEFSRSVLEEMDSAFAVHGRRPIIFHSFSNGGSSVIRNLVNLVEEPESKYAYVKDATLGFVIDSAPAWETIEMFDNVTGAMGVGTTQRRIMAAFRTVSEKIFPERFPNFWKDMRRLGWGRPQLYLYSTADNITKADKIDEILEEKRHLGQLVLVRRWTDSAHVAHHKAHKDEYEAAIDEFLKVAQSKPPAARL